MKEKARGAGASLGLVCTECRRGVDSCAFCDRVECRVLVCYRCLIFALGHSLPQPHTHGG